MESRMFEITVQSAEDLKVSSCSSTTGVYAIVSIIGDPSNSEQKQKTHVLKDCGPNPTWEYPMKFTVNEKPLQQNCLTLEVAFKSVRSYGDKDIGEVQVPIKDLFDQKARKQPKDVSYSVRTQSEKSKGSLNFNYKFGHKFAAPEKVEKSKKKAKALPVMENPVATPGYMAAGGSSGFPAPPPPPPPPPYGYGYWPYPPPPPPYGYGHQWYRPAPPPPLLQYGKMALMAAELAAMFMPGTIGDSGEAAAYDGGYDDDNGAGGF